MEKCEFCFAEVFAHVRDELLGRSVALCRGCHKRIEDQKAKAKELEAKKRAASRKLRATQGRIE